MSNQTTRLSDKTLLYYLPLGGTALSQSAAISTRNVQARGQAQLLSRKDFETTVKYVVNIATEKEDSDIERKEDSDTERWIDVFRKRPSQKMNEVSREKDSLQESPYFYEALEALRGFEVSEDDEDDFAASVYAITTAQKLIVEVYRRIGARFPQPVVFANGNRGILLQWDNSSRQVRLVVPRDDTFLMYVYHEDGSDYDAEAEVSPDTLASWLTWLNRA